MKKISGNLFRKRPGGLDYREEKCYNQRIKKPARRKRKFDMDVQLKPIAEDNFLAAFNLKLNPDQEKYVSHPVRSLAQAYVYRDQCQPFGIYCGDEMVGYVMVIYDYDVPEYDIWHMMIDSSRQGRGLGREALKRVLEYIGGKPFGDSDLVALTCHRDNAAAMALYTSLGFEPTGAEDDDEIEFARSIHLK